MHMFSGKVVSYAPAGGGLLLPEGDKRLRGLTSETEERQAAYGAQVGETVYVQGYGGRFDWWYPGALFVIAASCCGRHLFFMS